MGTREAEVKPPGWLNMKPGRVIDGEHGPELEMLITIRRWHPGFWLFFAAWLLRGMLGLAAGPGTIRRRFWWLAHNCIAHPLLGLRECRLTYWLHDQTADLAGIVD
ncbi:MAG: hypothetical protein KGL39_22660 [Patescibacteria group bacterium]|nr:hypothetical protein [Patescibacteria group bacterium]